MNKAIVKPFQTLFDIAVQYLGSNEGVFELAKLNGLSITDEISVGQELKLPNVIAARTRIYFLQGNYVPAVTAYQSEEDGIDFMGIEFDFIVQ